LGPDRWKILQAELLKILRAGLGRAAKNVCERCRAGPLKIFADRTGLEKKYVF
jgi:hypothetical protein